MTDIPFGPLDDIISGPVDGWLSCSRCLAGYTPDRGLPESDLCRPCALELDELWRVSLLELEGAPETPREVIEEFWDFRRDRGVRELIRVMVGLAGE